MSFLDHLEELRWRILWALIALVVCSIFGFLVVQNFDVLTLLKKPIAGFLPDNKLFVTRPTDAFIITVQLSILVGAIFAAPVILYQVWGFLSPALYEREKRFLIPALMAGLVLFAAGALMAYMWVLPAVLRILFSFQREDLEFIITANEYFRFAIQIILAFGIVFQTPLFITLLSALGLLGPRFFARNRPYATVVAAILAAFLTPPDVVSMLMMMAPVLLLYELGILMARVVWKGDKRKIAPMMMILFLLLAGGTSLEAQQKKKRPEKPDSLKTLKPVKKDSLKRLQTDSLRLPGDTAGRRAEPLDTATARKLGLPTQPSRSFPAPDSIIRLLQARTGYQKTRYAADSLTLHSVNRKIDLTGSALIERDQSILEADTVSFLELECKLDAHGDPALFEGGSVLVGLDMRYNTCENRGIVARALTNFEQNGVDWYLRGGLGVDSASVRLYSSHSSLTSCDEPTPHYHFSAKKIKWVTNNIMVARPVVLYIRDVPILWLPFMFQDVRQGRRSGWLVPRFGLNDLVRTSPGYQRHISNVGYYFALSDYFDVQSSLDWFAGNFVSVNGQLRYRWRNRFINGAVSLTRLWESGRDGAPGGRSLRLVWNHQQSFNQRTRLNATLDYATSSRVVQQNSVDPFLTTATLASALNFSKQYDWGSLTIGGRRTQNLSDKMVTENFPTVSLTPAPINISDDVTWSPSLTFTNNRTFNSPAGTVELPALDTTPRFDTLFASSRRTDIRIATPLRVGRWNWTNDVRIMDFISNAPTTLVVPDPDDSTRTRTRFYGTDFSTGIDWNTSINLPILFPSSWKLQPAIQIRNAVAGPFLIRNRFTRGRFVSQKKTLSFNVRLTPTVFGFFPGVGPLARIRHSISPIINWSYAPGTSVPEDYQRALDPTGRQPELKGVTRHVISLGLSQTFEGKHRLAEGDSTDPRNARKIKLLSLQTSSIEFDFEQAKRPGRTGWKTQTLANSFTSDLLPGFSIRTVHDLWAGPVGFDTTRFDPFLTQVSARFTLSGRKIAGLLHLLGLRREAAPPEPEETQDETANDPLANAPAGRGRGLLGGQQRPLDQLAPGPLRRGLQASFTFDDQRRRPTGDKEVDDRFNLGRNNRTLGMAMSFSPTEHWSVSWNTQYNFTLKEFGQHVLRLDRDLHRWRATFSFVKAPNGNFAFNFFVSLLDQPDIKFQYDQRTIGR